MTVFNHVQRNCVQSDTISFHIKQYPKYKLSSCTELFLIYHIGSLMVSVLVTSAVDREF